MGGMKEKYHYERHDPQGNWPVLLKMNLLAPCDASLLTSAIYFSFFFFLLLVPERKSDIVLTF